MTGFIVLDTNIYRQLGLKFLDHIDYVNLVNFCYASGFEMTINDIVALEYSDYFRNQILDDNIEKLNRIAKSLNSIPYFEGIKFPNLENKKDKAFEQFIDMLNSPHFKIKSDCVNSIELTKFLLKNKHGKDNTRDFLIWMSIVDFTRTRPEDKIYFISNDKIFKENESIRENIENVILDRISVYSSISDFLFENGFKIEFFTKEFLEKEIDFSKIEKELFKRPTDILSYVSIDYWHCNQRVKLLTKDIESKKIDKFYTYIDPEDNKSKFLAHIILKPKITFEIPQNFKVDYSKLNSWEISYGETCLETYNNKGNPIYEQEVMFLVGGTIDLENKRIIKQDVYDFFLDYYKGGYA